MLVPTTYQLVAVMRHYVAWQPPIELQQVEEEEEEEEEKARELCAGCSFVAMAAAATGVRC